MDPTPPPRYLGRTTRSWIYPSETPSEMTRPIPTADPVAGSTATANAKLPDIRSAIPEGSYSSFHHPPARYRLMISSVSHALTNRTPTLCTVVSRPSEPVIAGTTPCSFASRPLSIGGYSTGPGRGYTVFFVNPAIAASATDPSSAMPQCSELSTIW